jgi:hypothetical protein
MGQGPLFFVSVDSKEFALDTVEQDDCFSSG